MFSEMTISSMDLIEMSAAVSKDLQCEPTNNEPD